MASGSSPLFKPGDRVRLTSDRGVRGAVVEGPREQEHGFEYAVLINNAEEWLGEDQLEAIPLRDWPRWVSRDELVLELAIAKLQHPLSDALYAYRASRTLFEPYQFRPALKFLRSANQRMLIADEVGLGKTIEAAIIYLELKARLDISRALVLSPSRLTGKWQDELSNRFEEEFEILDAAGVRRMLNDFDRLGPSAPLRAIASFELLRRPEFMAGLLDRQVPLDLLIVDEAHHLRNEGTATYQLGVMLVSVAEAVVFLTATPLHLRNRDLYNLLNLLSPEDFDSPDLFDEQVRPNEHINRAISDVAASNLRAAHAELKLVETTALRGRFVRNPFYQETVQKLARANGSTSLAERVGIQWELMSLNTLAAILSRTRKREVANSAVRAPVTLRVSLTPSERRFYDAVLHRAQEDLLRLGMGATGFTAIMKERQAASCLAAMRERIEDAAKRHSALRLEIDVAAQETLAAEDEPAGDISPDLVRLSREIGETDSKFDRFAAALSETLAATSTSKVLVFSFFRGTLDYLRRRLQRLGYHIGVIHGGVPVANRRQVIEDFRDDPAMRVMLSSEVGAEGLDFQFCDVLVNYDLPWNPMQVEQRIGRLDRFGQEHERIRILNFYIENTIETRIFQRLYDRIGLFERSIGDLEAILGEEVVELRREALQARLTADEQAELADRAAERIERRQLEEANLEQHKDELLGQGAIFDQRVMHTIDSGRVVTADEIRALVGTFLRSEFPRSRITFDDEEPCATIDIDPSLAERLRRVIERKRISHQLTEPLRKAISERRRLPFTFDADFARQRPNLEFVTARHPLAIAALEHRAAQDLSGFPAATIEVPGHPDEAGLGHFFIYLLTVRAATQTVTLEPVVVLDDGRIAAETGTFVLRAIQDGRGVPIVLERDADAYDQAAHAADAFIAGRRHALERDVTRRNEALIAARTDSVRASFDAKLRRVEELLGWAADERIRRMRTGQLQNLRARRDNKLEDLERGREVAVSSGLVAGGRILIVPDAAFGARRVAAQLVSAVAAD